MFIVVYYFHDISTPPQILMSTPTTSTLSSPTTSCCENGRPIMTDPHTGQTVCSCQYGSGLLSAYSRVPSLTDSVYSAGPYGSQSYMPLGTDPSAFYSPLVSLIPPLASFIHFILHDDLNKWLNLINRGAFDCVCVGLFFRNGAFFFFLSIDIPAASFE